MSAERFHTHLRNHSTPLPHTCVSGMEGKGMEEEGNIIHRHLRNARAVDNCPSIVAVAARRRGDGA